MEKELRGCIYFMGSIGRDTRGIDVAGRYVKIGSTDKITPDERFEQLKKSMYGGTDKDGRGVLAPYTPLCYVRSATTYESACRSHFTRAPDEYGQEAVVLDDKLRGYLIWMRRQYFIETDPDGLERPIPVEPSVWLPGVDRVSTLNRKPQDLFEWADTKGDPWSFLPVPDHDGDSFVTPEYIIAAAKRVLGDIDLDPASDIRANGKYIQATKFYDERTNGLHLPWFGRVWLSPPFKQWRWWRPKILNELRSNVKSLLLFAPVGALTARYFQELLRHADAVVFLTKRVKCEGYIGNLYNRRKTNPKDGRVILAYGVDLNRLKQEFDGLGVVKILK